MELPLAFQMEGLLLALAFGLGLGFIYDLIRPLRRSAERLEWLFDALFSLCTGFALFVFAMCRPWGRPGLWEIMAVILGFGAYMWLLSPLLLPVFAAIFAFLMLPIKKMCSFMQKVLNSIFQNVK